MLSEVGCEVDDRERFVEYVDGGSAELEPLEVSPQERFRNRVEKRRKGIPMNLCVYDRAGETPTKWQLKIYFLQGIETVKRKLFVTDRQQRIPRPRRVRPVNDDVVVGHVSGIEPAEEAKRQGDALEDDKVDPLSLERPRDTEQLGLEKKIMSKRRLKKPRLLTRSIQ